MRCRDCGARFEVAPLERRWPNGETLQKRGMRLTGLCRDHYWDLAKYRDEMPWPTLTKDEEFDYVALHGEPSGMVT